MAYRRPYIILFGPQLIEVRYARTGELVQVIRDKNRNDFQFLWDGRSFPANDGEEPLVHVNVGSNIAEIKIMQLTPLAAA
jgi:CNH domain